MKGNTENVKAIARVNLKKGRRFKCKNVKGFDWETLGDALELNYLDIADLCDKRYKKLKDMLDEQTDDLYRILREVSYVHYYGY